jgi:hypothetical protein
MDEFKQSIVDMTPEYRLYYDTRGDPISYVAGFYSDEEPGPEGTYIVIDKFEFLCKRHDVKVLDGKLVSLSALTAILKYVQKPGIRCAKEDISIVVDETWDDYIEWGIIHSVKQ